MYAKIASWMQIVGEDEVEVFQLVGSEDSSNLNNANLCSYVYTGVYDEASFSEVLDKLKPKYFYVPTKIIDKFSVRFYDKYSILIFEI